MNAITNDIRVGDKVRIIAPGRSYGKAGVVTRDGCNGMIDVTFELPDPDVPSLSEQLNQGGGILTCGSSVRGLYKSEVERVK